MNIKHYWRTENRTHHLYRKNIDDGQIYFRGDILASVEHRDGCLILSVKGVVIDTVRATIWTTDEAKHAVERYINTVANTELVLSERRDIFGENDL